jgi:hypothetical protein
MDFVKIAPLAALFILIDAREAEQAAHGES